MQNIFTIRVGEKQADGVRDVFVLHNGDVHFSTSHCNMKWAFLTRFPAPSKQKQSLEPVSVLPNSPFANGDFGLNTEGGMTMATTTAAAAATDNNNYYYCGSSDGETMQEYLCVFYRDEPKNRQSHYTAHEPSTICSAYNTLHPAAVTHFVLKNIVPTAVLPGLRGVFVHGSRLSSRGTSSRVLQVEGFKFHQAADLWWMASQLTIKSVYVNAGCLELMINLPKNPTVTMVSPLSQMEGGGDMMLRYALVDAIVLTQFQTYNERLMTVAVCGNEICLATTAIVNQLDTLLWVWWPQRLHVPQLHVKGTDVSVAISEGLQSPCQVLFLFDAPHSTLHVLMTPNLMTGKGAWKILFSVSTNCPPIVLPCLRHSTMQPIMVCHYPSVNEITLYHIPTLLGDPSSSTCIATMSLAGVLPNNFTVDGVLYHTGSTVAFQLSSSHSNKKKKHEEGETTSTSGSSDVHESGGGKLSHVVSFPSLLEEQDPLVHLILEALELVLETNCVASLQCELIRRSWESKHLGQAWDFRSGCIELIIDIARTSMTGISTRRRSRSNDNNNSNSKNKNNSRSASDTTTTHDESYLNDRRPFANNNNNNNNNNNEALGRDEEEVRLCDILLDPNALTVDLLQHSSLCNSGSTKKGKHNVSLSGVNISQLWTEHQCGLSVFILHLLAESLKLQERLWVLLEPLAKMNLQLCHLMGWKEYVWYYSTCLCVPDTNEPTPTTTRSHVSSSQTFQRTLPEHVLLEHFIFHADSSPKTVLNGSPPMLYTILQRVLQGKTRLCGGWPAIKGVQPNSPLSMANRLFFMLVDCFDSPQTQQNRSSRWWLLLCRGLLKYNIDPKFVSSELCVGVAQTIERALAIAKEQLDDTLDNDQNTIIGRLDRLQHVPSLGGYMNPSNDVLRAAEERAVGREYSATLNDDDGVIMRPDFPKHWGDSRLDIVQSMLNTAGPVALPSQVDGADAIYTSLKTLSRRATALPVGRGMLTLCTQNFRVRDSVPIPRLNLEGRTSDGITITNSSNEISEENLIWPLFHNGCAAGLRFLPLSTFQNNRPAKEEQPITRHWVLYQTRNITCLASRAGLLLAAGLLGHLKVLQRTDIYSLLVSHQCKFAGREAVTIAVMLGLSCSLRGTCNSIVFNCLSMHIQSLTPATEDIEVSLEVQTAALVSIGILYQRSPDGFLAEMLLVQISRIPSDEHFRDREGYALGAGFSLGLMLLGIGSSHGIPNVENRLLKFMEGARREAIPSVCEGLDTYNELHPDNGDFLTRALLLRNAKDSFKNNCTRVFEGDCFNTYVSSPAAVIALGLMYLQTGETSMANKIFPPNRLVGLQCIYPELCLLRSMMSSLILWSNIEPSLEWVRRSIPSCLLQLVKSPKQSGLVPAQVRYLMMNLGHCLAGVVLALGLRYAGSMDADAKAVVLAELKGFMRGYIGTTGIIIGAIQRSTGAFQTCLSACTVSLALIMAGTGDAQCLAVMQKLYKRTHVKYGDHLALSMAIGLLFLGGGQLTLSNSLSSTAALIMAFYPIWPETASDNKLHLQVLRQLYCLAVVPRVIQTVDVLTNRPVSVPIRVIVHHGRLGQTEPSSVVKELWTPLPKGKEDQAVRMITPCLLPDPSTVTQIEIRSAQHYNLTIYNEGSTTIGDNGLVVRVLEKNITQTDSEKYLRSPGEELVVYWIKRLFHDDLQHRPRPIEASVIIDNVNLLFAAQESFLTEFGPLENDFLPDFVMNVRHTLMKRYGGLLHRCRAMSPHHPLSHIITSQKSLYSTAVSLVRTLQNEKEYTSDLIPVLECLRTCMTTATTTTTSAMMGSEKEHSEGEESSLSAITVSAVMKWLSQALHFHGLVGCMGSLPHVLAEHAQFLQRREQRFLALYFMNQRLLLRPQVLEDLVECCVEYVD